MDEQNPKEAQQELFEEFSTTPKKPERFPQLSRSHKPILISTNVEQSILAGILLILAFCGVFFLGVVRGKSLSKPAAEPELRTLPVAVKPTRVSAPAAVSPAVPRAAQPVLEAPSKPYTIQLVTHRKKEMAEAEMNALRARGIYSFIIPSGEYLQVCAGQYASKEEAKKDLARFSGKYKDCFLRRK